jgi:hypothetical protein
MTAVGTVTSGLASVLSSLTPGQLLHLGNQITQKDEVRAMSILTTMMANPAGAPMAVIGLTSISDLPPAVLTFAEAAAGAASRNDQAGFASNMAQAMATLQAAPVSPFNLHIFG